MLWLLGLMMRYIITFSIPYLYGIVMDWPMHYASSAGAGLLAYLSTSTICHSLWQGFWGQEPPRQVARYIRFFSSSVGIAVAVSLHYILDYWPRVRPMMRLLER